MTRSRFRPGLLALLALSFACSAAPAVTTAQEIRWDRYGVPHIRGDDLGAVAWAFGWAQAESHANLLLRLYGQARGRAAEYWGADHADSDRWVRVNDIPGRARAWLAQATPEERTVVEQFVAGVNAYAQNNPDALAPEMRQVLPVSAEDVLAHVQRVVHFTFVASPQEAAAAGHALEAPGSNAWAVAPSRTANGHALLLMNPHLPWGDLFTWYEAQLTGGGIDAYGVALLGMPMLNMAFNDRLGWAFTVNTYDGADLYRLSLRDGGYAWDGGVRAFEARPDTLRVRNEDGSIDVQPFDVVHSVHGPVIAQNGNEAVALRVAGIDRPHMMGQLLGMLRAQNFEQFTDALDELQLPMFTVVYADADGRIMHAFNGAVPRRAAGDFAHWRGVLPGDSSRWLWTDILPFDELPRVIDPPTGWVQNANEPPWTATLPMALDPDTFPAWIAPPPGMPFRPQSSATMLADADDLTLERMIELKHSTVMQLAARIVDDVVAAARAAGNADAKAAADILAAWDFTADSDSRGGVLFVEFFERYQRATGGRAFAQPWSPVHAVTTPDGLADPDAAVDALAGAAAAVSGAHGRADVAWGDVYRLRAPGIDLPANGAADPFGVFRATWYDEAEDGRHAARGGDSFVAAIEFGPSVRAQALLTYGNATQPALASGEQLGLYARKQLRPVWRTDAELEANVVKRERFRDGVPVRD